MDAATFREDLETEMDVELERLGSSKLLVALTAAELDEPSVLEAAAEAERTAARTLEAWTDDEDHERAREAFAEFAEQERDHYDRVTAELEDARDDGGGGTGKNQDHDLDRDEDHEHDSEAGAMHTALRSLETTAARLGGLVGRALVSERTHLQVVSFFVNEGDERRADLFRELRRDTEASRERSLELLADVCATDEDWDRARDAAANVIEHAYDEYADSLDDLGVDPKPIC